MNDQPVGRWNMNSLGWVLGIVAVSGAYILLVEKPQIVRMRRLNEHVAAKRGELASRAQSIETLARTGREVADLSARVADFEARIPDQPALGAFLEELARIAQERKLHSDAIQPGEPAAGSDVTALPIAIRVRGPFSAVHGFAHDIEQMSRLIRFEQFKVATDEANPGQVKADLSLRVFYGSSRGGTKAG